MYKYVCIVDAASPFIFIFIASLLLTSSTTRVSSVHALRINIYALQQCITDPLKCFPLPQIAIVAKFTLSSRKPEHHHNNIEAKIPLILVELTAHFLQYSHTQFALNALTILVSWRKRTLLLISSHFLSLFLCLFYSFLVGFSFFFFGSANVIPSLISHVVHYTPLHRSLNLLYNGRGVHSHVSHPTQPIYW